MRRCTGHAGAVFVRSFMPLCTALLAVGAGCDLSGIVIGKQPAEGGGGGAGGAGGGPIESPLRPLAVHVVESVGEMVSADTRPVPAAIVMSHDADGVLLGQATTDDDGNADMDVIDGGFVSVLLYVPGDGFMDVTNTLTTVRITEALTSLRVPIRVTLPNTFGTMTVDVSWPQVPGASMYAVHTSCAQGTSAVPPMTSVELSGVRLCPGETTFDLALEVYEPDDDGQGPNYTAYGYKPGNTYVPGGSGSVVFDEIVGTTPGRLTVSGLTTADEIFDFSASRLAPRFLPIGFYAPPDFSAGAGSATLDFTVPDFPDLPLYLNAEINPEACGAVQLTGIFTDVSDLHLDPERLARRIDSDEGTWAVGPGELGDAIRFNAELFDGAVNTVMWVIYEPPATGGPMPPALEIPEKFEAVHAAMPELAVLKPMPQPTDLVGIEGYAEFFELLDSPEPHRLERRYRDISCDPFE